ncbi:hypothetical protein BDR04DRAFT_1010387 [Suillus decipiens]|nr:hypothetical protein BDR04DRAFT_1010387 [Suillus decipiens]
MQWVNCFICLADDSEEVPKLKKRQYLDFKLTQSDWTWLSLLHEALQFSSITYTLEAGLKNLKKWSQKTDDTDVYFICLGM